MCNAIKFDRFEFSDEELQAVSLKVLGEEVKVSFTDSLPYLPVFYQGRNQLVFWGNKKTTKFPRTGFCRKESLLAGKWSFLRPKKVLVLASSALVNGVWFQVRKGIEAVLITDSNYKMYCYILTQDSTHYFKIMTGSDRMPVLKDQLL